MATSVIPQSRSEKILAATINGEEYNQPPQSRIEQLLIELKEAVEEGGGSEVTVEQIKTSGEKIATITVDGEETDLYASVGGSGGGAVDTVNGKTGDVVLTASDVGALPDNTHIPADQIQSDWEQSDNTKKDYIKNKPTLGTAAAKDVPASGNAGNDEVVLGNDSRLSDARNAADVSSWAKEANKPTYTASEVGAIPSTDKGANGGVATLGNDGKVPSSQLPSMSGGHTIKNDGTDMTDRSGLNFIDHDLTDDSSGNETIVKPHRITSAEMSDICNPLPDDPTVVGNVRMSLLWTNPSTSSEFAAQEVSIPTLSNYDYYEILACEQTTTENVLRIYADIKSPKGVGMDLSYIKLTARRFRTVDWKDSTTLRFNAGYTDGATANSVSIPYKVYGIKLI